VTQESFAGKRVALDEDDMIAVDRAKDDERGGAGARLTDRIVIHS
jgi:hypothetical protein